MSVPTLQPPSLARPSCLAPYSTAPSRRSRESMYPTANAFQPTRRPTGEEDDWERVSFDLARALLRPSLPRRPLSVSLFADIYFVLVLVLVLGGSGRLHPPLSSTSRSASRAVQPPSSFSSGRGGLVQRSSRRKDDGRRRTFDYWLGLKQTDLGSSVRLSLFLSIHLLSDRRLTGV